MPCGTTVIIQVDEQRARAWLVTCKSWHCPTCSTRRRKQLVALAYSGKPRTFMTLTSNPAIGESPTDRAQRMTAAWRKLVKRIKRHTNSVEFEYLAVLEATKRGEPHMHILLRCAYIDQRWLSEQWAQLTDAPIVDIRRVDGEGRAARYVSKYLGKQPHRFGKVKRYFKSQRWRVDPRPQRDKTSWKNATSYKLNANWTTIIKVLHDDGYTVDAQGWGYATAQRREGTGPPSIVRSLRAV